MGKKKTHVPETVFDLPAHASYSPATQTTIIDSHTHLVSTFNAYRAKYPNGECTTVFDFVKRFLGSNRAVRPPSGNESGSTSGTTTVTRQPVEAIVDVWCEAPVIKSWRELADSAVEPEKRKELWGDFEYWFVMGVHPHEAKHYTDEVEADILEAMAHPRCVGWGEIGLDYHYMNSPAEVQQEVLRRQLRQAVKLGKPLTIHTREADDDVERILKEEVPRDHKIHIHCFTDTPALARNLLDHFPNLFIGITGVVTYKTNQNTAEVIRILAKESTLRIVLESDAPYMIPTNIYDNLELPTSKSSPPRLAFSHSGMLPWVAQFVAEVASEPGADDTGGTREWTAAEVLDIGRANARKIYGLGAGAA